jgi:hypothetical protein
LTIDPGRAVRISTIIFAANDAGGAYGFITGPITGRVPTPLHTSPPASCLKEDEFPAVDLD